MKKRRIRKVIGPFIPPAIKAAKEIRHLSDRHPRTIFLFDIRHARVVTQTASPREFSFRLNKALGKPGRSNLMVFAGKSISGLNDRMVQGNREFHRLLRWKESDASKAFRLLWTKTKLEKRFPKYLIAFNLDTGAPLCVTHWQERLTAFLGLCDPAMRIGVTGRLRGHQRYESRSIRHARVALAFALCPRISVVK